MSDLKPIVIIDRNDPDEEYRHDCERIVRIFAEHGYQITPQQARKLWENFSDDSAAGWLMLGDDDGLVWSWLESYWRAASA